MQTRIRVGLLAALVVATIILFSCAPPPVSIEKRISDFVSSLNGDRTDTYTNLDPSIAAYSFTKLNTWWDTPFPSAKRPFSFTPNPPNTSNPSDVEVSITGAAPFSTLYKFTMVNIGTGSDNWVIQGLQPNPPGGPALF